MTDPSKRSFARSPLQLTALGLLCALILAGIYSISIERIQDAEQSRRLEILKQVFPQSRFDNDLHSDYVVVSVDAGKKIMSPLIVYRARTGDQLSGLVVESATQEGYNGEIRLLTALDTELNVIGVISLSHQETPGLGDKIDRNRGNWLQRFAQRPAPESPEDRDWLLKKDGGSIEQISGATITSRASLNLLKRSLEVIQRNLATIETASVASEIADAQVPPRDGTAL